MNIDYAKLENYLYEKICQYITDVINKKSEVYVVSFLLYTDGGQENNFICYPENKFNGIERFPALCIEYNTECDFENMMLLSGKNSDNIYCKERWGIRFDNFYDVISAADDINAEDETMRMLYESLLESGANADDWLNQINSHSAKYTAESAQFLYDWLIENKITDIGYENMATAFDKDNNYIGKGPNGYYETLQAVSNVARRLQEEKVISDKFGKIPIIVHDFNYSRYTYEATENANPNGEAKAFLKAITTHWGRDCHISPKRKRKITDKSDLYVTDIECYLYDKVLPVIKSWDEKDIYAISFWVLVNSNNDFGGIYNFPEFSIGYNTESDCKYAPEYSEERCNFAFWNDERMTEIIAAKPNSEGANVLLNWYLLNGIRNIGYENMDEDYDENMEYIGKGPNGYYELLCAVSNVARRLQEEKIISDKFGGIPIIVHDLEYAWYEIEATKNANPSGEAKAFLKAIESDFGY